MEPTDITIEILRGIQSTLVKIDGRLEGIDGRLETVDGRLAGIDARLAVHDQRLERLEGHAVATTETMSIIAARLSFFERAATVATEGRHQLEDRVDDLESRVEKLERPEPT